MSGQPGDENNGPGREVDRLAHRVIGAAIEVHRILGSGLLESLYEEALCFELTLRGIPFARQSPVVVKYKEQAIGSTRLDLIVADRLIIELKAVDNLVPAHVAQLISYLRVSGLTLGLLINFNVPELRRGIKRVINSDAQLQPQFDQVD